MGSVADACSGCGGTSFHHDFCSVVAAQEAGLLPRPAKRLSMLDQCALDPRDIGAAQLLFDNGTHTLHEARQAVARYKLSNGWLPRRLTITDTRGMR